MCVLLRSTYWLSCRLNVATEYKGYYTSEALLYTIHSDTPVRLSENPSRFLLDASGGNSSTVQLVPGHLGRIGDYVRFVC